jgi:hypothetical protein
MGKLNVAVAVADGVKAVKLTPVGDIAQVVLGGPPAQLSETWPENPFTPVTVTV